MLRTNDRRRLTFATKRNDRSRGQLLERKLLERKLHYRRVATWCAFPSLRKKRAVYCVCCTHESFVARLVCRFCCALETITVAVTIYRRRCWRAYRSSTPFNPQNHQMVCILRMVVCCPKEETRNASRRALPTPSIFVTVR